MKVLFLEDVPPGAKSGDVKEVAAGYARNYLIPKNLATVATPSAIKSAEVLHQARLRQKAKTAAEMKELAALLEGKGISIKAKVGAGDRLYGSITKSDISARVQESLGIVVDRRKIVLDTPLRKLGNYDIVVKLSPETEAKLKVTVEEEKGENERGAATAS